MKQREFDKIGNLDKLPQLPQVMLKIIDVCNREDPDRDELIEVISSDAAFTARLMQLMNSAWVNLNKEIQSIESAILYLGVSGIKNLALSMAVVRVFDSEKTLRGFNLNRFWYHSFKCAAMARHFADATGAADPDEAFLAGLIHDIGKLVLMVNYPDEYRMITVKDPDDIHLAEFERESFGITHSEVSEWLCRQWRFSPMISDSVLYVDEPVERVKYAAFPVVRIVNAANYFSSVSQFRDESEDQSVASLVGIDGDTLENVISDVENEVLAMADCLGTRLSWFKGGTSSGRISRAIDIESPADAVAVELVDDTLRLRVKEFSNLYGTLESLLGAEDPLSIVNSLETGIRILFSIQSVFTFLCDQDNVMLTGFCENSSKTGRIVNSIAISMINRESLMVRALAEKKMFSTISSVDLKKGDLKNLAISDIQIMRLLESEAMFCIPLYLPGKTVGVIAAGVENSSAPDLIRNSGMITMLARLAAVALDNHRYRSSHRRVIQKERAGAASDSIRKVIHEINNPLLIITSYLKMLSIKLPDRHPAQKELTVIDEEIERIGELVKELGTVSGSPERQFEWIDLYQLFRTLLDMIKKSILIPKGINADIHVAPDFPKIRSDKNVLKQILINLLKNSAEAMERGGNLRISLRQIPGSVKIVIDEKRKTSGQIEISVKDDGPGIPDEIMKRLFEPYNSSKKGKNSGLGLSIVNNIVKSINGVIECHTEKGVGTEFRIVLPVS